MNLLMYICLRDYALYIPQVLLLTPKPLMQQFSTLGKYHHPSFAPLRRYMGICVMGHQNDWGTLLAFSGQGSGMQNTLQHMGQSHTTKSCLTQDTSSNAINKMPRGRGQRPGLPKIHWKNPKIQPNTVTFITLWFLKKSNFLT